MKYIASQCQAMRLAWRSLALILWSLILPLSLHIGLLAQNNCDFLDAETISFSESGGNTSGMSAVYLLVDGSTGNILAISNILEFPPQADGVYQIIGAYFDAGAYPIGIAIGNSINAIIFPDSCSGFSAPLSIKVCPSQCDYLEGEDLDFQANGGNTTGLDSLFLLTDDTGLIIETSGSSVFGPQSPGNYGIYAAWFLPGQPPLSSAVGDHIGNLWFVDSCGGASMPLFVTVCLGQSQVGDMVWEDANQNGQFDPGENGVDGIMVSLYSCDGILIDSTSTNNGGKYLFENLSANLDYYLSFSGLPSSYIFTFQDQGGDEERDSDVNSLGLTPCFSLNPGQSNLDWDAGIRLDSCNNVSNGGIIGYHEVSCTAFDPAEIVEISAPSGGVGSLEYMWLKSLDPSLPLSSWMVIPGANGLSYDPPGLNQSTYFVRCVRRSNCTIWWESNLVLKEVNPNAESLCEIGLGNDDFNVFLGNVSFPGISKNYHFLGGGKVSTYQDGTAKIEGLLQNTTNPLAQWYISLHLSDKRDYMQWSALPTTDSLEHRGYKGGSGNGLGSYHRTWDYYEVDSTQMNTMTGFGPFSGKILSLSHDPDNYKFGFQLGYGANGSDSTYGIWGWFAYSGAYNGKGDVIGTLDNCKPVCIANPRVACRVFLQGCFDNGNNNMNTGLNQNNVLPLTQPFNMPPWNYSGAEQLATIPPNMVDWILVEVRSALDSTLIVSRTAAWLDADGYVHSANHDGFPDLNLDPQDGEIFMVLTHRNHLDIMSSIKIDKLGRIFLIDFSDNASKYLQQIGVIGDGYAELAPGIYGMISGDGSGNNVVNANDIQQAVQAYFESGYLETDATMNGITNATDLQILVNNYFKQSHKTPASN